MKYIKQFLIILGFSLLGEVLSKALPLPIPAAIYGLVLLFLALFTGLLQPEQIAETANFLISVIGLFLVSPAMNILAYYHLIAPSLIPILVITVTSTFVVFAVSGLVTQWLRKRGQHKNG